MRRHPRADKTRQAKAVKCPGTSAVRVTVGTSEGASDHITVCICTYRRPVLLADLLSAIEAQVLDEGVGLSIVIVDNDVARSARETVDAFRRRSALDVTYTVVEEQSIALARNAAVSLARGSHAAFIDDDEIPDGHWLRRLLHTLKRCGADGVLGPVAPRFERPPPSWVLQGAIFHRPRYPTGTVLRSESTRTGNVLFLRSAFHGLEGPFDAAFACSGEDRDFFRRAIAAGRRFVWCDEAVVHESIPPSRWRRSFMFRRALLRGQTYCLRREGRALGYAQSVIALVTYPPALLLFVFLREDLFVDYLVRLGDHLGRLLGAVRIRVIREKYLSQ